MPVVPYLTQVEQSVFWKQMTAYAKDHKEEKKAIKELKANVRAVTENAAILGTQVVQHMPHYTDHGERHYLNVLALMGALVPKDTLKGLHPVECALCILTAYTHDLGMVLSGEEYHAVLDPASETAERKKFEGFLERYTDEVHQIAELREANTAETNAAASQMEGHLLATYIRETHTDPTPDRLRQRLQAIANEKKDDSLFRYAPVKLRHPVTSG
ncbi:MAG: hypothetical protein AAF791_05755 [Bacteroidota bacterium]